MIRLLPLSVGCAGLSDTLVMAGDDAGAFNRTSVRCGPIWVPVNGTVRSVLPSRVVPGDTTTKLAG